MRLNDVFKIKRNDTLHDKCLKDFRKFCRVEINLFGGCSGENRKGKLFFSTADFTGCPKNGSAYNDSY